MLMQRPPEYYWKGIGEIRPEDGQSKWTAHYEIQLDDQPKGRIGLIKTQASSKSSVYGSVVTEPALTDTPGNLILHLESS